MPGNNARYMPRQPELYTNEGLSLEYKGYREKRVRLFKVALEEGTVLSRWEGICLPFDWGRLRQANAPLAAGVGSLG